MKKVYRKSGILIRTGVRNKNGRIYPSGIFANTVNEYLRKVKDGRALGELGHPETFDVNLTRVSHIVTDVKCKFPKIPRKLKKKMKKNGTYERDTYIVNYRFLDTEFGNIAKSISDSLVPSPRGVGSVDSSGVISGDYKLLSVDLINKKDKS